MRILELFSGTESISNQFRSRGHEAFTIDIDPQFSPSLEIDIMEINATDLRTLFPEPDIIWASPPCEAWAVPAIGKNWRKKPNGEFIPISDRAVKAIAMIQHTLKIIKELDPKYWFLENPRAILRKMDFMGGFQRATISYCQYGDTRMKPTDLWGNNLDAINFKPMCKPIAPCHERAPRGSRKGTQGLKNRVERARIPDEFGKDLCIQLERVLDNPRRSIQTTFNFVEIETS